MLFKSLTTPRMGIQHTTHPLYETSLLCVFIKPEMATNRFHTSHGRTTGVANNTFDFVTKSRVIFLTAFQIRSWQDCKQEWIAGASFDIRKIY